jgi:hypothetical protein
VEGMLSGKSIIIDGDSLPIKELIAYLFGHLMSELYSDWKRYGLACSVYQRLSWYGGAERRRRKKHPAFRLAFNCPYEPSRPRLDHIPPVHRPQTITSVSATFFSYCPDPPLACRWIAQIHSLYFFRCNNCNPEITPR